MKLKHVVIGAGIAALTATGIAPAASAAPRKADAVTPEQCRDSGGSVQRDGDGVGTCVGGTSHDGEFIDDSAITSLDDGTTSDRTGSDRTADRSSDRLADDDDEDEDDRRSTSARDADDEDDDDRRPSRSDRTDRSDRTAGASDRGASDRGTASDPTAMPSASGAERSALADEDEDADDASPSFRSLR